MRISVILIILGAIMLLRGFADNNEKYIVCSLFIGATGALIFILKSKKEKKIEKGDSGKSLRDNHTWPE